MEEGKASQATSQDEFAKSEFEALSVVLYMANG